MKILKLDEAWSESWAKNIFVDNKRQHIWDKVESLVKVGHYRKSLIFIFENFWLLLVKSSYLGKSLSTTVYSHASLVFFDVCFFPKSECNQQLVEKHDCLVCYISILSILFWNFTKFWYRFDSPQVKKSLRSKNLTYELPYE